MVTAYEDIRIAEPTLAMCSADFQGEVEHHTPSLTSSPECVIDPLTGERQPRIVSRESRGAPEDT